MSEYKTIPDLDDIGNNLDLTAEVEITQSVSSVLGSFRATLLKILNLFKGTAAELLAGTSVVKFITPALVGNKIIFDWEVDTAYPSGVYLRHDNTIYRTNGTVDANETPLTDPTKFKTVAVCHTEANTDTASESVTINKRSGVAVFTKVINADTTQILVINNSYIQSNTQYISLNMMYDVSSGAEPHIVCSNVTGAGELSIMVKNINSSTATSGNITITFKVEG